MFDFKFNWDENLNTDVDVIDRQHKELFRIGRAVEQLLITNCYETDEKQLLSIVCELRDYVAYHFYEEERLMEIYQVSTIEDHRAQHNKYRDIIMNIDVRKLGDNPYTELKKIKECITELVFEHMIQVDKPMAVELKEKMKEPSV